MESPINRLHYLDIRKQTAGNCAIELFMTLLWSFFFSLPRAGTNECELALTGEMGCFSIRLFGGCGEDVASVPLGCGPQLSR